MQFSNVSSPIEVTELGMVTEASLLQSLNALFPIEVTELGMATEARLVQPENAFCSIFLTESPIYKYFRAFLDEESTTQSYTYTSVMVE